MVILKDLEVRTRLLPDEAEKITIKIEDTLTDSQLTYLDEMFLEGEERAQERRSSGDRTPQRGFGGGAGRGDGSEGFATFRALQRGNNPFQSEVLNKTLEDITRLLEKRVG